MTKQEASQRYNQLRNFYNTTNVSHTKNTAENRTTSEYIQKKKKKIFIPYYKDLLDFSEKYKNYLQISTGLNKAQRELIVIDYDGNKNIVPDILEAFKEIKDCITIIQKNNNRCQIQININPIKIKHIDTKNIELKILSYESHNYYLKITRFLNLIFDGDLDFKGWRCQNPFYAKENPNDYKLIKIATKKINFYNLYQFLVKKFDFNINKEYNAPKKKPLDEDVWEILGSNINTIKNLDIYDISNNQNKKILNNIETSNLNLSVFNLNLNKKTISSYFLVENSRNISLFKESFKMISRDKTKKELKPLSYYLEILPEIYDNLCFKFNKFEKRASYSQIQSIIRSAYNKSVDNFVEYSHFTKSQLKVSELIRFSNKLRNYLSVKEYKTYGEYLKSNIENKISKSYFYQLKKLDILYFKRRLLDFLNYNFDFYSSYLISIIDTLLNNLNFKQSVQYYQLFEINSDFECIFPANNSNFNPYFKIYEENLKLIA